MNEVKPSGKVLKVFSDQFMETMAHSSKTEKDYDTGEVAETIMQVLISHVPGNLFDALFDKMKEYEGI